MTPGLSRGLTDPGDTFGGQLQISQGMSHILADGADWPLLDNALGSTTHITMIWKRPRGRSPLSSIDNMCQVYL